MQNFWTFEQLLGLSPDHFTIRSGQGHAKLEKWRSLGERGGLVWGAFDNKQRPAFEVVLDLGHMHFSCSCMNKKFPCPHIIGLHLLWFEAPELFTHDDSVPPWVQDAQTRFLHMWQDKQMAADGLIAPHELAELQSGLAELERWLYDLVQNGLAALPDKKKEYWTTIANRMGDVQALRLATAVKNLSNVGQAIPNWPEHYLKRLGPIALLLASFKQFDTLPIDMQADLLAATGRPFPTIISGYSTNGRSPIHDQWLILGHQTEAIGSQQTTHTWAWGLNHNRPAIISQTIQGKHPNGICYITGSVLSAELHYALSAWPLAAQFVTKPIVRQSPLIQLGYASILEAIQQVSTAKSKNPWLTSLPLLLREATPILENGRWYLIDSQNYSVPLPPKFNYGWLLQSIASGAPMALFGVWDGDVFEPLSVEVTSRWVDLHAFRGIK